jgi:hypothetical protein
VLWLRPGIPIRSWSEVHEWVPCRAPAGSEHHVLLGPSAPPARRSPDVAVWCSTVWLLYVQTMLALTDIMGWHQAHSMCLHHEQDAIYVIQSLWHVCMYACGWLYLAMMHVKTATYMAAKFLMYANMPRCAAYTRTAVVVVKACELWRGSSSRSSRSRRKLHVCSCCQL